MASSAGLGFGGASHGPTAVAHRGSVGVFRHAQPGQPRGSKGTSGGAQVFCREWEQYQNMVRKCEKTCLLVFLCIEILGKWRKFTEMIIWVDGKSWKIQVARQSHPRRGYPEQRPQDLAWRPSRIAYGMALSKDGKLGNLTKWRFLAGKLTINGDVQLPCLITGGYASQCWRNTIRQNAGDTTCFLLCACSFFPLNLGASPSLLFISRYPLLSSIKTPHQFLGHWCLVWNNAYLLHTVQEFRLQTADDSRSQKHPKTLKQYVTEICTSIPFFWH